MDHGIRVGAERSGDSANRQRKGERMKYYDNLGDYTDTRPSKLMEFTKRLMPAVFFVGGIALMFMVFGALEVL